MQLFILFYLLLRLKTLIASSQSRERTMIDLIWTYFDEKQWSWARHLNRYLRGLSLVFFYFFSSSSSSTTQSAFDLATKVGVTKVDVFFVLSKEVSPRGWWWEWWSEREGEREGKRKGQSIREWLRQRHSESWGGTHTNTTYRNLWSINKLQSFNKTIKIKRMMTTGHQDNCLAMLVAVTRHTVLVH